MSTQLKLGYKMKPNVTSLFFSDSKCRSPPPTKRQRQPVSFSSDPEIPTFSSFVNFLQQKEKYSLNMDDSFSMIDLILQQSELRAWELWWGTLWPGQWCWWQLIDLIANVRCKFSETIFIISKKCSSVFYILSVWNYSGQWWWHWIDCWCPLWSFEIVCKCMF